MRKKVRLETHLEAPFDDIDPQGQCQWQVLSVGRKRIRPLIQLSLAAGSADSDRTFVTCEKDLNREQDQDK